MTINIDKLFILCLFYLAPVIDALSGYLILSNFLQEGAAGSPSQVFRFFILVLMLFILSQSRQFLWKVSLFFAYIVSVEIYFFIFHQNSYGLAIGIVYGSKVGYLIMVFLTLSFLINRHCLTSIDLLRHTRNYIAITAAILIFSFLSGLGFNTYAEGTFGVKGFFAAGNGLGVFMGIGLLLSIYYWYISRERFALLISLVIFFATVIIGSKTAFLLGLIGLLSILVFLKSLILIIFATLAAFSIIGFYANEIFDLLSTIFDVILFRYENSESIFSWIFSNRDNYFANAISQISFEGFLLLRIIIGFGAYISFREPFQTYPAIDILESDMADILFMYGVVMLIFYFMFIVTGLYKGIIRKHYFLTLSFILLMGHSFIAGHVIFNGMSGVLVPILFLLILMKRQHLKCQK